MQLPAERRAPMPLGFDPQDSARAAPSLSPEGRRDNSPRFQPGFNLGKERQNGMKSRRDGRGVAQFQPSLRDFQYSKLAYPMLKHWAIVANPSGMRNKS